jgi:hypothetical protein
MEIKNCNNSLPEITYFSSEVAYQSHELTHLFEESIRKFIFVFKETRLSFFENYVFTSWIC